MKKHGLLLLLLLCCINLFAQLKIENVYSVKLRNSGAIITNGEVKGYYLFYQSDKISKEMNEYTLQVVDENLNKVQDIKFKENKAVLLLEASFNGNSLAFLFRNGERNTLDMKIYGLDGKLKFTYTAAYDKKSEGWMNQAASMAQSDNGVNNTIFNLKENGFLTLMPVVTDEKDKTFEVRCYSSVKKKQWTYRYFDEKAKTIVGEFIGSTDSLAFFTVYKNSTPFDLKKSILAVNFITNKKAFEMTPDVGEFKLVPSAVLPVTTPGRISLMGSYYEKDENVTWDAPRGMGIVEVDNKGRVLDTKVCSWATDFAQYLPVDKKGRIGDIGFLFIHKIMAMADGGYTVVAEGFRKQTNRGKIAFGAFSGMEITDLVLMKFDNGLRLKGVDVFDKTRNTISQRGVVMVSPQMVAMAIKGMGGFDYEYTTGDPDNSTFNVCFSDYVKDSEYKGRTFNTIRFTGTKYVTDKIELKTKASEMHIMPAKSGFVMIYEYFKKTKSLELRIEKLG